MTAVREPQPTWGPAQGYQWVIEPDPTWRLATEDEARRYRCRGHVRCPNSPVAALDRGRDAVRWWFYCPKHMYGRWIEDGQVAHWIARKAVTA
jgi:hypothetical protein